MARAACNPEGSQTRNLTVTRVRPVKQSVHLSPMIQNHRQFLAPQDIEFLHGQEPLQQHHPYIPAGRAARVARAARAKLPHVNAPVRSHLYHESCRVQISPTAARSASRYLDHLAIESAAARLRLRKILEFHSRKLNNYLNSIKVHQDDREIVQALLDGFFNAIEKCTDHVDSVLWFFRSAIDRAGYQWAHKFLHDQFVRGDLEDSWKSFVTGLEELAFVLGIDLDDTIFDKTHDMQRRARDCAFLRPPGDLLEDKDVDMPDMPVVSTALSVTSNIANVTPTRNPPSAPVQQPRISWQTLQPLQFQSLRELSKALVEPVYLMVCRKEMGTLDTQLRNGPPQSIDLAIVEQVAIGLASFGFNSQHVWFDARQFAELASPWIQLIFDLRNGLLRPDWQWSYAQESGYRLCVCANQVFLLFDALQTTSSSNALQTTGPSASTAAGATSSSTAQNATPSNSDDDDEDMLSLPDIPSPQTGNSNASQPPVLSSSQFSSSSGSSQSFGSSTSTLYSSVSTNSTSLSQASAPPTQTSSSLPATNGGSSAVLDAFEAAPSNSPVANATASSSGSSLSSTLDKGKGKVMPQAAPLQSLATFGIANFSSLEGLMSALKDTVFLGEMSVECASVTEMVTKQLPVAKSDMLLLSASIETVWDASEDFDDEWYDSARLSVGVPEWHAVMISFASLVNGESGKVSLDQSPDLQVFMCYLNTVLKKLVPDNNAAAAAVAAFNAAGTNALDFSLHLRSDLEAGAGPFSPDAITSKEHLQAIMSHPELQQSLSDASARIVECVKANRVLPEDGVGPYQLACDWILHSARQSWWSWRLWNDSAEMAALWHILENLSSSVLAPSAKAGDQEARVLQKAVEAVGDRLAGNAEPPKGPRMIKAIKPRRARG